MLLIARLSTAAWEVKCKVIAVSYKWFTCDLSYLLTQRGRICSMDGRCGCRFLGMTSHSANDSGAPELELRITDLLLADGAYGLKKVVTQLDHKKAVSCQE